MDSSESLQRRIDKFENLNKKMKSLITKIREEVSKNGRIIKGRINQESTQSRG